MKYRNKVMPAHVREWTAKFSKTAGRFLFPPGWIVGILSVASAALLIFIFPKGSEESPTGLFSVFVYGSYMLAAYSLTVLCAFCAIVFPKGYRRIKQAVYRNRYGKRYMTDGAFRTHFWLYVSLVINTLYAALNMFTGIWYHSIWSITIAAYYSILAVMRFLLLHFVNSIGLGKERRKELRRSRLCGMIIMTVNLTLAGVVSMAIVRNEVIEYSGVLIYIIAIYTFYITVNSVISLFRYRKYNSPVIMTAKGVNLTASLVSMLTLTIAMLSQFGGEKASPYFRQVMIGSTGAGVCIIVMVISVFIITRTNMELKKLQD